MMKAAFLTVKRCLIIKNVFNGKWIISLVRYLYESNWPTFPQIFTSWYSQHSLHVRRLWARGLWLLITIRPSFLCRTHKGRERVNCNSKCTSIFLFQRLAYGVEPPSNVFQLLEFTALAMQMCVNSSHKLWIQFSSENYCFVREQAKVSLTAMWRNGIYI